MSLEVITMWYNEAFLAPFFLKHYAWADRITLLYDVDTTDNTRDIVKKYPNVHIVPFSFPDMMDDELKRDIINKVYARSQCDWVLSVDADEFVFIKSDDEFCYDLRQYIEENSRYDLFFVTLFQIFHNTKDVDLDPDLPAVPQRRYGDPNISTGLNKLYNKPILVRSGLNIDWTPGCHAINIDGVEFSIESSFPENIRISVAQQTILGAHWAMADPVFSVERRVKNRRMRQSQNNLEKGMTVQHHHVTVKNIMDEFAAHANNPQLF